MSIGIFTEKDSRPTERQVAAALGQAYSKWNSLIGFVRENYPIQEDFRFLYGKNYGWGLRFRIRGKLFTSMFPNENYLVVQVNLSPGNLSDVSRMDLGNNACKAIETANLYPEGKWVFVPVKTAADVRDIKELLRLKAEKVAIVKKQ